jgi:hypothetical protein
LIIIARMQAPFKERDVKNVIQENIHVMLINARVLGQVANNK